MADRWECRYSSCEMMYLEVTPTGVHLYLDHSPGKPDHYSFDEVLAGALDAEVHNLFGGNTLEQLKAAVRARAGRA